MCFQERSLTKVLSDSKSVAFMKINQERGDRRDQLVSPENDLATHYELKTNKRMTIKQNIPNSS